MRHGFHALKRHASPFSSKSGLSQSLRQCPRRIGLLQSRLYASVSAADLQFGQPVHETHPHLLKAGERMHHYRIPRRCPR